jgi:hypothetical protein
VIILDISRKFKTPAEAKKDAKKLVEEISSLDNDSMSIEDIFSRARAAISALMNQENIKLNTLLLIALKQKMMLLEKVYKLIDRCLNELLSDKRLNTFNIDSNDLLDKTTKLLMSFSTILDSLTNKNEIINFSVTNNITSNTVKGEITLPTETREKLKLLTMQYLQNREEQLKK